MTYSQSSEAGADIIDTLHRFSEGGTSQRTASLTQSFETGVTWRKVEEATAYANGRRRDKFRAEGVLCETLK